MDGEDTRRAVSDAERRQLIRIQMRAQREPMDAWASVIYEPQELSGEFDCCEIYADTENGGEIAK